MTETITFLFFAGALVAVVYFFAQAANPKSQPKGKAVDVVELEELIQLNPDDLYDVGFWRQSGALHRTGGTAVSREKAIKEVKTAFKRSGIEFVRFATNDTREVEVWRAIHHGKGTREGRRLGGASIKRVLWQD